MSRGEFLTRFAVWMSIAAYTIGCVVLAQRRADVDRWARLAWTIGCAAMLAHFVFAFHFYHGWSHTAAYVDTARQTAEVIGSNWGGGLFINYAVAMLWIVDVTWWWLAGLNAYRRRSSWITLGWHSFLIFIIFNATVVFKDGLTRWIGLLVSLTLLLSWVFINRQRSIPVL